MGWPEAVAVVVGMVTAVLFYQKSFFTATLLGLGIAMVVYGILIFARKTWRELAFKSGKIEEVKVGRKMCIRDRSSSRLKTMKASSAT